MLKLTRSSPFATPYVNKVSTLLRWDPPPCNSSVFALRVHRLYFPLSSLHEFPCSINVPDIGSCHLYTACYPIGIRLQPLDFISQGPMNPPDFNRVYRHIDVLLWWFTFVQLPMSHLTRFALPFLCRSAPDSFGNKHRGLKDLSVTPFDGPSIIALTART